MLISLLQNNQQRVAISAPSTTCLFVPAQVGILITPQTMVGTGGAGGPYTFTAIGLPPGLSLASNGLLSGAPTASGTFNYTVFVTDHIGTQGFVNCSIPVAPSSFGDDGFGIIRFLDQISNAQVLVTAEGFGDLVQVDGMEVFDDFGIIGPCYQENLNLKIEYARHGKVLSDEQPFEIPDRYVTYVRHYVLARALEREGPGQDLTLAQHFDGRWKAGIDRVNKRKNAMAFQKSSIMGGGQSVRGQKPPRVRLPWQYGSVVR